MYHNFFVDTNNIRSCITLSLMTVPVNLGSCKDSGFPSSCCVRSTDFGCTTAACMCAATDFSCFCDKDCGTFDACCSDFDKSKCS